jgi:hypothetical protein
MSTARATLALLAAACAVGACSGRPSYWNTPVDSSPKSYGLTGGVVLLDDASHRVVVLTAQADQQLAKQTLPVGHHVTSAATSPDGNSLFVLSAGDWPRRSQDDELPALTVIALDPMTFQASENRYTMSEPLANLAIDPGKDVKHVSEYAVAYAGTAPTGSFAQNRSFVQNPNEIVIFDLRPGKTPNPLPGSAIDAKAPKNPISRTIRSFGGTPQRLTFTPTLNLPASAPAGVARAPRRLLLIETDLDVTLLDLDHTFDSPPRLEITVRLTSGASAQAVTPAGLVVDGNPDDGRIAVRTSDTNVYSLQLVPSPSLPPPAAPLPNDFNPQINLTDVGGTPSDIAFVHADNNQLRIAALVPSTSSAVLIEPTMGAATQVPLPAAYSSLSLVTDVVGPGPGTDVALLWGGQNGGSGVAFWTLGVSVGTPYRSLDVVSIEQPIQTVLNVPPGATAGDPLKVLETATGSGFYVLDLASRTAPPLQTSGAATLSIAPDGNRLWAFAQGGTDLAMIDFKTLSPVPLTTDAPIDAVYDIARPGGRSLVAVHAQGTVGATVFDVRNPDSATSQRSTALILEGP